MAPYTMGRPRQHWIPTSFSPQLRCALWLIEGRCTGLLLSELGHSIANLQRNTYSTMSSGIGVWTFVRPCFVAGLSDTTCPVLAGGLPSAEEPTEYP